MILKRYKKIKELELYKGIEKDCKEKVGLIKPDEKYTIDSGIVVLNKTGDDKELTTIKLLEIDFLPGRAQAMLKIMIDK